MGPGLVILSAALWATVGVATGLVPSESRWPPEMLALSRLALAGPILLLLGLLESRGAFGLLVRLDRRALAIFAMAAAIFQISIFHAFPLIGPAACVFISVGMKPVFGALWMRVSGGAPLSSRDKLAAALGVFGIFLLSVEQFGTASGASWFAGAALATVAAAAFVAMAFSVSELSGASPTLVSGAGLCLASLVVLVAIAAALTGGVIDMGPIRVDRYSVSLVGYLVLFPTAVAYVAFSLGMRHCSKAFAGLSAAMVEPAVAAVLACWLLAESFSSLQVVGGLAMLAVAALCILSGKQDDAAAGAPRAALPKGSAAARV